MSYRFRTGFPPEIELALERGDDRVLAEYVGGLPESRRMGATSRMLRSEHDLSGCILLYGVFSRSMTMYYRGNTRERSFAADHLHLFAGKYPEAGEEAARMLGNLTRDPERTVSARAFGGLLRSGADFRKALTQAVGMCTGDDETDVMIPRGGDYFLNVRYLMEELEREGE